MRPLVLGTRGSRLARWQADWVANRLRAARPDVQVQVEIVQTSGDRDRTRPVHQLGTDGAFTHQLEERLLAGSIDLAVHSLKDLPTTLAPGLTLACVPIREDPRDVLVTRDGRALEDMPSGAKIGSSSLRRQAFLRHHQPGIEIVPLRGNVDTRLRRLEEGLDGVVLAMAGLLRLGRVDLPMQPIDLDILLPAPGQGALAVETRLDNQPLLNLLASVEDRDARRATEAERMLLNRLGAGCLVPVGALATVNGAVIQLRAAVANPSGSAVLHGAIAGEDPDIGGVLADRLLAQGAADLLAERVG